MFRQAQRSISTVIFRHNHYANDPAKRNEIQAKVKEFAKTEGLDDRGAEEATVKYYLRILPTWLTATIEVLSIIIPATRMTQNGLPSNSGTKMANLLLRNMSQWRNEEVVLMCLSTVRKVLLTILKSCRCCSIKVYIIVIEQIGLIMNKWIYDELEALLFYHDLAIMENFSFR